MHERGVAGCHRAPVTAIMPAWRLQQRPASRAARSARPAEHGQRRHHRVALQRADVLRGPVRDVLHDPLGRPRHRGALGPGDRPAQHPVRRAQHHRPGAVARSPASSACSRRSGARSVARLRLEVGKWGLREWFVITFLMGSFFVAGQVLRVRRAGQRGPHDPVVGYGSMFYLTTGFHGLHVTGGLIAFLFVLGRTYMARASPTSRPQRHRRVVLLALRRRRLDRPVRHHLPDPVTHAETTPTELADDSERPAGCREVPVDTPAPPACWSGRPAARSGASPAALYAAFRPARRQGTAGRRRAHRAGPRALPVGCSSCHGLNAEGIAPRTAATTVLRWSASAPPPSTSRSPPAGCPAQQPGAQIAGQGTPSTPTRRSRRWPPTSPRSAPGPAIPDEEALDTSDADVSRGGGDLPDQLLGLPQLRGPGRRAPPRRVRARADERRRGTSTRR